MDPLLDEAQFSPDYEEEAEDTGNTASGTPIDAKEVASGTASLVSSGEVAKPKRRRNRPSFKICPICGDKMRAHVKRHVHFRHFPWYLAPTTACWECKTQENSPCFRVQHASQHETYFDDARLGQWINLVNGVLHFFRFQLDLDDLQDLLQYVVEHVLFPAPDPSIVIFSELETSLMKEYEKKCNLDCSAPYCISPPHSVVCLVHWRIIANLLKQLGEKVLGDFKVLELPLNYQGFPVSSVASLTPPLPFVDTHFHLDVTLKRTKCRTFSELSHSCCSSPLDVKLAIANYVYPKHWPHWISHVGADPRVRVTFGIHPHFVKEMDDSTFQDSITRLRSLLSHPLCVGVGEVGIDSSNQASPTELQSKLSAQEAFLRAVIPLCQEFSKVLVLHCRDAGTGEASRRMLAILSETGASNLPIHRHCFTGGEEEMERWLQLCPNVRFGFTAALLRSGPTQEAVKKLDLNRILLESDAPYLSPDRYTVNTPYQMFPVLECLARLRNLPPSMLIDRLNTNARLLYNP